MLKAHATVLIIEDQPGMRQACIELLYGSEEIGAILSAASLEEGLQALAHQSVDVILLDLRLPDSDGADTLEAVTAAYPEIPVVVMTALYLDRRLMDELICGGAFAILDKAKMFKPSLFEWVTRAVYHRRLYELAYTEPSRDG